MQYYNSKKELSTKSAKTNWSAVYGSKHKMQYMHIKVEMKEAKELKNRGKSIAEIKQFVSEKLSHNPLYKPDYYQICNADTLEPLSSLNNTAKSISLIAVFVGKIRLIDNLALD